MDSRMACSLCVGNDFAMEGGCDCAQKETAKNIQKKKGCKVIDVFLDDNGAGLYLYEKFFSDPYFCNVFVLRTCLRSSGSGQYEDHRKVVLTTEDEMERAKKEAERAKVTTKTEESKNEPFVGVDEMDEEGEYDEDTDLSESDSRTYIFISDPTNVAGRFRPTVEGDDPSRFIPVRYLQEERENKASMGWVYQTTTKDGEFWTRPKESSADGPTIKVNPFGVDDLDVEGRYDEDADLYENDLRTYIFIADPTNVVGRFRRTTETDDPKQFIPVCYLQEERENRISMGWVYTTTTKDGEFWNRPTGHLSDVPTIQWTPPSLVSMNSPPTPVVPIQAPVVPAETVQRGPRQKRTRGIDDASIVALQSSSANALDLVALQKFIRKMKRDQYSMEALKAGARTIGLQGQENVLMHEAVIAAIVDHVVRSYGAAVDAGDRKAILVVATALGIHGSKLGGDIPTAQRMIRNKIDAMYGLVTAPIKQTAVKKEIVVPKKALSAYLYYASERRPELKKEQPTLTFGELTHRIAAEWTQMKKDGKTQEYDDLAALDKERYEKEMEDFNRANL